MAIQTKIEKYCEKFINNNFDKRDRMKGDSLKFEWFVNSMHSWHYSSQSYNSKSHIGKEISLGTAQGGDSFFITIDNQLYSLKDDIDIIIDELKKNQKEAKIVFHLIQTKKSTNAKLGDFKKFVEIPLKVFTNAGIEDNQPILVELKNFIQKIIGNEELKNVKHAYELFFYTEKNENDVELLRKEWNPDIEFIKKAYAEYTNIKIHILGSEFLNNTYEEFISNDLKLYVAKSNLKAVTDNEYLIGYITAEELLNCIAPAHDKTNDRILYPDVFKNNIRLYLGTTPVNKNIEKTLIEEPEKFHLYNNGLTITTKAIDPGNINHYEISPVNIVNGCQTANSIYNVFQVKSVSEKSVKVPVKIIIAQDEEYEKITIRTNSQNGLSEQDLVSITNIQKELEELFLKTNLQNYSFHYKRQNSIDISSTGDVDFIVTISDILRASFSSIMLIPHKVSGYFDTTTGKYIDNLFEERFLKLYHLVTVLLKATEEEMELNFSSLQRLKYHVTYLLYKLCNKGIDINNIEKYFRKKTTIDDMSYEEIKEQNKIIDAIYSNLHWVIKDKEIFGKTIKYIIEILQKDYPLLVNLDTKDKEKILYKTVDAVQRGEKVFANFDTTFSKTIKEIILT
jgi:hypothetical protein